jgi:hypothetical protein
MYSENLHTHPLLIQICKGQYRIRYTPFRAHVLPATEVIFSRPPSPGTEENPAVPPSQQPWIPVEFEVVREYLSENSLADGPELLELLEVLTNV